MASEINKEGLPSIDDVVADMASRGITSFSGEDAGDLPIYIPEVATQEVALGNAEPHVETSAVGVEAGDDGQADTLPEATPEGGSDEGSGGEEGVSQEGTPVEQPKSANYLDFLEKQESLRSQASTLDEQKAAAEKHVKDLAAEVEALKAGKPKDPMEALLRAGFTYEDATKMVLQGWEPEEVDPVDAKVAPVLSQLEEAKKQIAELNEKIQNRELSDRRAAAESARLSTLASIKEVADVDEFPHINSFGDQAYSAVNDFMLAYYQQYQVALDIKDACAIIENKYEEMLSPALKSERLRKKYGLSNEPEKQQTSTPKPPENQRKTLTNQRSSSAPATPRIGEMTDVQAQEEIAKMLKFHD